jgi:hypothetical protein
MTYKLISSSNHWSESQGDAWYQSSGTSWPIGRRRAEVGRQGGARGKCSRDGSAFFLSPLAQLRLRSTPALVARAQGSIRLGPKEGEVDAVLPDLGSRVERGIFHIPHTIALDVMA